MDFSDAINLVWYQQRTNFIQERHCSKRRPSVTRCLVIHLLQSFALKLATY